ncbi:hypothetical protein OJ997_07340 [Solirubrobacter phytolaccae]|uniref:Fibronectin type-III domain-containing protein n=1 Tax=Solirubrobacter phytolaccae TaxID=1404360 RepID=A0A9X3N7X1_9ACTN|nr:hypothetical protein [Solirubrobacter phytolaccae]MDA0180105.1 hypothetical protein [Solirubrobacter phytolaccae]
MSGPCRLAVVVALALPASADAAPLSELPFQRLPDGTACLAPTGAPAELSRWAGGGAELLTATASGLGRPTLVPLGELTGCPRADADATGAAVVAGATEDALRVALREPGGTGFGTPVTLAAAENVFDLSVAVSPHGDAVVTWAEYAFSPRRVRLRVARRDAGGSFGTPTDLVPWRPDRGSTGVLAAMAADGEAVVLTREPTGTSKDWASTDTVRTGARGTPLGPATPLPPDVYGLALGVGPDGRVVVAATSGGSVAVLERPRGGPLSAPQPVTDPKAAVNADQLAVAFGADGRTVVAWHEEGAGTTGAAVRDGATGFGRPIVIVPPPKLPPLQGVGLGLPVVRPLPPLQAAVAPDGRVSVAWTDGDVRLATLAGTAVVERARLGSRLRDPEGLSLLALPDGRRALAWTNQDRFDDDSPARTHYALEGAPAAREPAAPRVTIGTPRESALRPGQWLVLPVRCSAACDLSVTYGNTRSDDGFQHALSRAGTVMVRLPPSNRGIAPARPGPVKITVRSSAPGARTVTRTVATPRLRRLPALPLPRIEDVRARRLSGGRVEVRWRMSSDARDTLLSVTGTRTRAESQDDNPAVDALWGQRRRSYRVVLEDAADTRWVRVEVMQLIGERKRTVTVRLPV